MGKVNSFFNYYSSKSAKGGVQEFSLLHFSWMAFTILLMIIGLFFYRRMTQEKRNVVMKLSASLLLILYIFRIVWALLIGKFSADSMLPFHLCALMVIVDFIAVFWDIKLLKEFGYATGLPGAFMAYLTPDINGFPLFSIQYQVYIFDHFFLMFIPLLWIFGDRYKPDKSYAIKITGIMACLAIIDGFINTLFHSNYMFVSKAPINTPFVAIQNHFGYLSYLVFLVGGTIIAIQLMYMPWRAKKI